MSHVLMGKGLELMEMLPPYYQEEHVTRGVQAAFGMEIERIDSMIETLIDGMFPTTATDEYGLLSLWEAEFGLPVAPEGIGEEARRSRIIARLRGRRMESGSDWEEAVSEILGIDGWRYLENEPGAYEITIYTPFAPGSDQINAVETLVRPFTPAHIDIIVATGEGFIVDVSLVDEEVI